MTVPVLALLNLEAVNDLNVDIYGRVCGLNAYGPGKGKGVGDRGLRGEPRAPEAKYNGLPEAEQGVYNLRKVAPYDVGPVGDSPTGARGQLKD